MKAFMLGKNNEKKMPKESKLVKWLYSGEHPQQKYYRGLYNQTNEREMKLEAERSLRDSE